MAKSDKKKSAVRPRKAVKSLGKSLAKPLGKAPKPLRKQVPVLVEGSDATVLDRLHAVVLSRREADPATSHSARLLSRGAAKVAQKFGEEAVECIIEAVAGNHDALVAESADVLYHLMVLWVSSDLAPAEVWAELARREGISGIAEKASRLKPVLAALKPGTRKIP